MEKLTVANAIKMLEEQKRLAIENLKIIEKSFNDIIVCLENGYQSCNRIIEATRGI